MKPKFSLRPKFIENDIVLNVINPETIFQIVGIYSEVDGYMVVTGFGHTVHSIEYIDKYFVKVGEL